MKGININSILIIYLLLNLDLGGLSPLKYKVLSPPQESEEENKETKKEITEGKSIKKQENKKLLHTNPKLPHLENHFNIHNAKKRLKYVNGYFERAEKIRNETLNIKNASGKERSTFLLNNIKHGLGDSYKEIENITKMLPLLETMSTLNKEDSHEIKEEENKPKDKKKEYNEILDLVNMLS